MKATKRAAVACEIRALTRRHRQLARALAALEQAVRVIEHHEALSGPPSARARVRARGRAPRPLTN